MFESMKISQNLKDNSIQNNFIFVVTRAILGLALINTGNIHAGKYTPVCCYQCKPWRLTSWDNVASYCGNIEQFYTNHGVILIYEFFIPASDYVAPIYTGNTSYTIWLYSCCSMCSFLTVLGQYCSKKFAASELINLIYIVSK